MTEAEMLKLTRKNNQLLTSDDLVNKEPRTLLLGSTPQGHAWHVYQTAPKCSFQVTPKAAFGGR